MRILDDEDEDEDGEGYESMGDDVEKELVCSITFS